MKYILVIAALCFFAETIACCCRGESYKPTYIVIESPEIASGVSSKISSKCTKSYSCSEEPCCYKSKCRKFSRKSCDCDKLKTYLNFAETEYPLGIMDLFPYYPNSGCGGY